MFNNNTTGDNPSYARSSVGQATRSELQIGQIYEGTVSGLDGMNHVCRVTLSDRNVTLEGCVWCNSIMANLIGFKVNYLPPVGSRVIVLYGSTPFIISGVPDDLPDLVAGKNRTVTGESTKSDFSTLAQEGNTLPPGATLPIDMLEGEFEISNMMGVALQMLTNFAKLSAGDRAKVEVHLLNDLVRVVSNYFQHVSGFGEEHVYRDHEQCNSIEYGVLQPRELYGRTEGLLEAVKGAVDLDSIDRTDDSSNPRYAKYLGFLGDFINVFVMDAVDTLGNYADQNTHGAGKARFHVGTDGTVLIQSISEIAIERAVRVVVPKQKARPDDPDTDGEGGNEVDFDKIWDYGVDLKNVPQTCYQLREYARYLSNYRSLSRFHREEGLTGKYHVPSEGEADDPKMPNTEIQSDVEYVDSYACWRIMRDGSIILLDGTGSSIVMTEGSIKIAARRRLEFEAGSDISFVAGQNIFMKARRSIELSAVVGSIKMKARTAFKALCEWGSIHLKADTRDLDDEPKTIEDQADSEQDPAPEVLSGAIVLDSELGSTIIRAGRKLVLNTTGAPTEEDEDIGKVIVQPDNSSVDIKAGRDVTLLSRAGNIQTQSIRFLMKTSFFFSSANVFDINQSFTVKGSLLNCNFIKANVAIVKKNIAGPERGGLSSGGGLHYNHISKISEDEEGPVFATDEEVEPLKEFAPKIEAVATDTFTLSTPSVDYIGFDQYDVFESYAQQYLRIDGALGDEELGTWTWDSNPIITTARTTSGYVWPGRGKRHLVTPYNAPLTEPAGGNGMSFAPATSFTESTSQAITFKYIKH